LKRYLWFVTALAACSRVEHPRVERIAILPFENLSSDPSLDPVAASASAILGEQIIGAPDRIPIRASTVGDAYLAGATRLVFGNVTRRDGTLDFEVDVEDAARHKSVAANEFRGAVLDALNGAAHALDPQAQPFPTSNTGALAAWARGDYERAVALDPDFGAAWIAWAESLAANHQGTEAIGVASRALDRPDLRSPIDRARLAVMSADLRKDIPARAQALAALQRLDPADTALLLRLADADNQLRDFAGAADAYRKMLALEPSTSQGLLGLGYAEAFAGNVEAARRSFEEYGRDPEQKTNSLDSMGEAYFMNGRFADAQKYFLDAYRSNPNFIEGADLEKAAYAQWLAGDLDKAGALFSQYLDLRRKAHDPLAAWRAACWDFSTGRTDLAVQTIASAPQPLAARQLAVWKQPPALDPDRLKQAYQSSEPGSDGFVRTFYAAALVQAGDRDQARQLIARWPLPLENSSDPLVESLVFPKFLELRKTLDQSR